METLILIMINCLADMVSRIAVDPVALGSIASLAALFLLGITYPTPQGFPGKAMFDRAQPGGEHAEDVSPLVSIYSDQETPLLAALGMGPYPATNVVHEWLEDELIPDTTTIAGAVNAAAIVINVPNANIFQVGELINVGQLPNNELMEVIAVNGTLNQITVNRGYGASIAVAHASGEEVILMGEHSIEGDDAPDSQKTNKDRYRNITHIFNYAVEMTGTRQALIPYTLGDIGNEWAYTVQKRLREAMRDLEAAVLLSDTLGGNTPLIGSATTRRSMRGIIRAMQSGVLLSAGGVGLPPANCYRNVAGVNFTFNNFRALQQAVVYNNGARNASICVIPPTLKVSVARWKEAAQGTVATQATVQEKVLTQYLTRVETDYGPVDFYMMPRLAALGNVSMLLSPEQIKIINLVGRSFFTLPLGTVGDRRKEEIVGEYTVETKGVDKGWHSLCYNWTAIP